MYQQLQHDKENINSLLSAIKDRAVSYLGQLDDLPVNRPVPEMLHQPIPEDGIGLEAALDHFYQQHFDKLTASAGPRYWGFVTGGATPAAIAGDWLTSVFDQNTQSTTGPGDISALIEFETISLMLELFGLPPVFIGGFVTGATMANFTGLAVARQWAGLQLQQDIARDGITTSITVISATPHSSAIKTLAMLGLGSNNITIIKGIEGNREAIDVAHLETILAAANDQPVIFISSGGTVNTVDFDDMAAIAGLKKQYKFWWHIDAAFGGFAACSPAHKHLLTGWEDADSITVDCHKWMNVPYDSAVYLINKQHSSIQVQTFQNSNAPYLGDPLESFSYLNFGPENSRRFRALPAWFSLIAYGKKGFEWIVDNNIAIARLFAQRLEAETNFTLVAPVRLNVVCFTVKGDDNNKEKINQALTLLNEAGRIFITPTVYKGNYCLRAAFVNWQTGEKDIDIAMEELKRVELS
jgi:glutamate/tyrosine decarboxylase-like PLP-dependent enzyme